uniref:G-protein coupled receptors family 1 profile domain-containing protein n=1 Tax=Leptobrachium leishanense TaxID=445787 RepID=A0A8C5MQV5_9ANUR
MINLKIRNQTEGNLSAVIENVDFEVKFSDGVKVLIITLMSILTFFTVFGNILVMLAFIVDKRLRTQSNYFLLNLAICDFFVGAFSMPLLLPYMLNGKWMLGRIVCKLWLTIDYTVCVASSFSVVLISYDRFISVTKAVLYRQQQNRHRQTVFKMAAVWILSFILYGPAILFWNMAFGGKEIPDNICVADFFDIWYFNFGTSVFDFALPLISISFFNLSIYWSIKKRSKKKKHSSALQSIKEKEKCIYITADDIVIYASSLQQNGGVTGPTKSKINRYLRHFHQKGSTFSPINGRLNTQDVNIIKLSQDKKIAKSLLIIVCIFLICWAPYSFLISIGKACNGYCIQSYWYDITMCLLYANSAINPILYPLCHKSFRSAFNMIFEMCQKKRSSWNIHCIIK